MARTHRRHLLRKISLFVVLGLALLLCLPPTAETAEPTREDVFNRTAKVDGDAFRIGRSLLERQGKELLPFLKEKAKSPDWRERGLAGSLLLRLEEPAKAAQWAQAVNFWNHTYKPRNDGTILVTFDPDEAEAARQAGKDPPGPAELVLDKQAVPILVDSLLDIGSPNGSGDGRIWTRSLLALKHFAAAETAPVLSHLYGRSNDSVILDALVAIGKPALPLLRDTLRSAPTRSPDDNEEKAWKKRQEDYSRVRLSAGAALALGRIGDQEGAQILLDRLKQLAYPEQVESYCTALSQMQTPDGLPVIFAHLVLTAAEERRPRPGRGSIQMPTYGTLRPALLGYGQAARDFLRGLARDSQPLAHRALAAGCLFELEQPENAAAFYRAYGSAMLKELPNVTDDPAAKALRHYWDFDWPDPTRGEVLAPVAFSIERAYLLSPSTDLERLARLTDNNLAYEVAADGLLLSKVNASTRAKLILTLAARRDERALDVYRKLLDDKRASYFLPTLVEGMLLLDRPKAVPLLEEIQRRAELEKKDAPLQAAARLAAAVLPALQGDVNLVPKLLTHDQPSVREVAARYLARKSDPRGIPVLVKASTGARGEPHQELRELLVGIGKPAVAPLEEAGKAATDWREKLLCEACVLRITKPDLADKFQKAGLVRDHGFDSHAGPTVATYRAAGKRVAEAVGKEAVPLLEAVVAFGTFAPGPGVAVFALAEFKEDRSIPVLVQSFQTVGGARDGNLVSVALQAFGEKGIEAIKKVPPPDPDKERFDSRAGRFRGATETLTLAQDVKGVDNILDGLKLPRPEKENEKALWLNRMRIFLQLATKYQDPRLVEPAIKLLEQEKEALAPVALTVLLAYDDKRIVPLAAENLGSFADSGRDNTALKVLVKNLKAETGPFLFKRFKEAATEVDRLAMIQLLGHLGHWGESYYWPVAFKDKGDANKAATEFADAALAPLVEALKDANPKVQTAAAEALVHFAADQRAVKPIIEWVESQKALSQAVVQYLIQKRDPAAGPALLAVYRASGRRNTSVAHALGMYQYAEAIPDLVKALEDRLNARDGVRYGAPELDALADMGPAGLDQVYDVFKKAATLKVRAQAAGLLGRRGYAKAQPEMEALFRETAAQGVRDPGLTGANAGDRQQELQACVSDLAEGLICLDVKQRGYLVLCLGMLTTEDATVRGWLAWRLARLEQDYPAVKTIAVPLSK